MPSLRELRAERLLIVRELARRASVAPSTIFLIESGRTIPRHRVARQRSEVLHVDPTEADELRRRIEATKARYPRRSSTARDAEVRESASDR